MFSILSKSELFALFDQGIQNEIEVKGHELKASQDLAVYSKLRHLAGRKVGEIGGGKSRIIGALGRRNAAFNIEKFSGVAGGPSSEIFIDQVTNINAHVGDFSDLLPSDFFDALFSISVVEHIPNLALGAFLEDQVRVLRVGGHFLHAIDLYIENVPDVYHENRWNIYRDWVTKDDRIEAVGKVDFGSLRFSPAMVSNPDDIMYLWGKVAPHLNELRKRAQCVSVIVHGKLIDK